VQSRVRALNGQRELFIVLHSFVDKHHKAEIEKHISEIAAIPSILRALSATPLPTGCCRRHLCRRRSDPSLQLVDTSRAC
jgi:hypothetical protein